VWGNPRC